MRFYSTNNRDSVFNLKQAVLQGLPKDGGLFMPVMIPRLDAHFMRRLPDKSFQEIALEMSKCLLGDNLSEDVIRDIVDDAINFHAPLHRLEGHLYILELFHGPTLAFKDFGARFMAKLMSRLIEGDDQELTILVATSGDTGGAVASGFYKTKGIKVIILYPKGKVSPLQEKQLTTLGENITALEVEGTFDDCQALVKQAFLDQDLQAHLHLTSANSINIARLIPQSFYYFEAYKQLMDKTTDLVFVIPSGNFGNLTAGLIAKRMGLPVKRFVAATNINDVIPEYLQTGIYRARPSKRTISNAMDVGNPSNFARILDLYEHDWDRIKKDIAGYYFSDEETRQAITQVYREYNYIIDPHGAVGYLAFHAYLEEQHNATGIILETAHSSKFLETVEKELGISIPIPEKLEVLKDKEKMAHAMPNNFERFKSFLLAD